MDRKELKRALNRSGKRGGLLRRARSLYRKAGGLPMANGTTVAAMISVVTGRRMTKHDAWVWLLEESEDFISKIVTKDRVKKAVGPKFTNSVAWKAVRFEALKASNGCCVLCGRSNREHGVILHVDHIKPKSKWPELALTLSNLQVLCEDCNMGKGNRDDTDWRTATETDKTLDAFDWRAF